MKRLLLLLAVCAAALAGSAGSAAAADGSVDLSLAEPASETLTADAVDLSTGADAPVCVASDCGTPDTTGTGTTADADTPVCVLADCTSDTANGTDTTPQEGGTDAEASAGESGEASLDDASAGLAAPACVLSECDAGTGADGSTVAIGSPICILADCGPGAPEAPPADAPVGGGPAADPVLPTPRAMAGGTGDASSGLTSPGEVGDGSVDAPTTPPAGDGGDAGGAAGSDDGAVLVDDEGAGSDGGVLATAGAQTLPYTGLSLATVLGAGLGLLGLGLVLRRGRRLVP